MGAGCHAGRTQGLVVMTPDGSRLGAFGSAGTGPGQFLDGHDLAVDSRGAVYVGALNGRVLQKFDRVE